MRSALLPAAALALAALPPAAQSEDAKSASDIRCVIVAGTLAQSDDPDLKSLGTASLFYFWGRLEGRGDTANMAARIVAEGEKMNAEDMKAQAKTCSDVFAAGSQNIQSLSDALQKQLGANPAPAPPK